MTEHLQSASAVLLCVKEKLASAHQAKTAEVLDAVVGALSRGRGYLWTGIYLAVESLGVRQSFSGPAPASMGLDEVRSEIAVPIKLGVRTLGLIVAETGRQTAGRERALLQQTAKLIARYLTSNRSKQLLRRTREQVQSETREDRPHKSPQSARPAARKAAAGERISR
jgi:GAF domain-containing protein